MTARDYLVQEIAAALGEGSSAEELVDVIIRTGWQPRPVPNPNADYLEGVLDNGKRVPIEILHGALRRAV